MIRKFHGIGQLKKNKDLVNEAYGIAQRVCYKQKCKANEDSLLTNLHYYQTAERFTEEQLVNQLYSGFYYIDLDKARSDQSYLESKTKYYNPYKNLFNMLWKSTTQIGCALACCVTHTFWICSLYPRSDSSYSQFINNVQPRLEEFKNNFSNFKLNFQVQKTYLTGDPSKVNSK